MATTPEQLEARLAKRSGFLIPGVVVLSWLVLIGLVGVGGNFPLNDDYWYHWTARHLAEQGELRILPGAPQLLVWHAMWGAALIRIFGSSHVVLRCGTLTWGLLGLLTLYRLARYLRWDLARTLLLVACVGTSPWYVNLAFSYMTDVPHLVLLLAAILAVLLASEGQLSMLLASGCCLSAASLTRQIALLTVPAFVLLVAYDARRQRPQGWLGLAILRASILCLPLLVTFSYWQYWYTHVNGTTPEYQERWNKMRHISYQPLFHFLATWHYVGLWVVPIGAAFLSRARTTLKTHLPRRVVIVASVGLVGYAIAAPIAWHVDSPGRFGLDIHYPPMMPYLTNIVYLFGVGVPTIYETYSGKAPFPHEARWFGVILTCASILGGIVAAGLLVPAIRQALGNLRVLLKATLFHSTEEHSECTRVERALLLLVSVGVSYFFGLCMVRYIFDRYLLVFLPVALILVINEIPPKVASSKLGIALVAVVAVFSIAGTHEYLSWNAARDRAVKALLASGVADSDIDGGYEVNGPLRATDYEVRTGKVFSTGNDPWWGGNARYVIAFSPQSTAGCRSIARQPYWTFPFWGSRAIYTLDCAK